MHSRTYQQSMGRAHRPNLDLYRKKLSELFNVAADEVTEEMLSLGFKLRAGFRDGILTEDNIQPYEAEYQRLKNNLNQSQH